jgi:hypothetical protein
MTGERVGPRLIPSHLAPTRGASLPPMIDVSAYRIVPEALTHTPDGAL